MQHTKTFSYSTTLLTVSWLLTSSELLTITVTATVPDVGMSLFCYFSHLFFFLTIHFLLTYYDQYFAQSLPI